MIRGQDVCPLKLECVLFDTKRKISPPRNEPRSIVSVDILAPLAHFAEEIFASSRKVRTQLSREKYVMHAHAVAEKPVLARFLHLKYKKFPIEVTAA